MSLFVDLKMCLRFHNNCGEKIKLSSNHQTAQCMSPGECLNRGGVVISCDPMLTDMLYQVSETFSVSFSVSLSLSLFSLSDMHSEMRKCWTFPTVILQDKSTTVVARPTGTLRCTGEPVDNQGAGLSSCTKSQAKISQLQLLC